MTVQRQPFDGHNGGKAVDPRVAPADDIDEEHQEGYDELIATTATVCVVGAGVLIFEAALLPGLVLGVATMLVPKYLPAIGSAVNPLVKSTVRGAYRMGQKTKEMVAEMQEQVHDIVAEVDAEADKKAPMEKAPPRTTASPPA
jgi:hypothetical protein